MRSTKACLLALLTVVMLAPTTVADTKLDAETKQKLDKALAWLAKRQNKDGSWSDGNYPHDTAVTSFALSAFMSQGHLPKKGQYAAVVAKAARFLMTSGRTPSRVTKELEKSYLVGGRSRGTMYSHGFATLALAKLLRSTGDDSIKPPLKKAVGLIVRCQSKRGGWRYNPLPTSDDITVTVTQVMALKAAEDAGLHVPMDVLDKAVKYIKSCHTGRRGGFGYQPNMRIPGFGRTAAATYALLQTGTKAKQIPNAVAYIEKHYLTSSHLFYGHYYAAKAMHQIGDQRWEKWYSRVRDLLLNKRGRLYHYYNPKSGAWDLRRDRTAPGPVYQTSIAVIILSLPGDGGKLKDKEKEG